MGKLTTDFLLLLLISVRYSLSMAISSEKKMKREMNETGEKEIKVADFSNWR